MDCVPKALPAICIETRQANAAMKTMPNKTDRNDARALAQIMRTGWYRQVHVKSPAMPVVARAVGGPPHGAERDAQHENVARAILREAGIKLGTPSRTAFADRVRELVGADAEAMVMVEPLLSILGSMLKEFARLTHQVLDIVRKKEVCRRLMSAPGVGPITALTFRATIDRPERFGSSRAVGMGASGCNLGDTRSSRIAKRLRPPRRAPTTRFVTPSIRQSFFG
jgi:transposase